MLQKQRCEKMKPKKSQWKRIPSVNSQCGKFSMDSRLSVGQKKLKTRIPYARLPEPRNKDRCGELALSLPRGLRQKKRKH